MTLLVTGSAGHLGEAIMRLAAAQGLAAEGLDVKPSAFTQHVGSIVDPAFARRALANASAVIHAATLHKPHVETHSRQAFVDVNVTGALNLLEAARAAGVGAFVFTSTTSVFGDAMRPPPGAPAIWVDEDLPPAPRNIYGATKLAAEALVALFARSFGLPALTLRTSRFFPEEDDAAETRAAYSGDNAKTNELLFRRVDIEDAARAHLLAVERAGDLSGSLFIISATTPFTRADAPDLGRDAQAVVARRCAYADVYAARGWRMFPAIGRIYDNARARSALGWAPRWNFPEAIAALRAGGQPASPLATLVGAKGYHDEAFENGPYPVSPNT